MRGLQISLRHLYLVSYSLKCAKNALKSHHLQHCNEGFLPHIAILHCEAHCNMPYIAILNVALKISIPITLNSPMVIKYRYKVASFISIILKVWRFFAFSANKVGF